ncbi:DUF1145 domain-containing protein [Celerinatantimonas yamalensis]|uniref:DUF1145 domain-containing protein n=1 Tax=Celerinatantimonas yamalensis TaxID=559956 RepID=A0ABW9G727_9GAMM
MLIQLGRALMIVIWLVIISSPWTAMARIAPLLLTAGAFVLVLHIAQMLLIKKSFQDSGHWCKGDEYRLIFFGVFGLMTIRQRLLKK